MDEALAVAQVRAGRTDAFDEIVDRDQAPIVRYLARMTGPRRSKDVHYPDPEDTSGDRHGQLHLDVTGSGAHRRGRHRPSRQ